MATTFSAKEVAQQFGTDARSLRKFLRSHLPTEEQPGQGGRYSFTKGDVTKLKKAFEAWAEKSKRSAEATEAPAKAKGKKGKAKVEPETTVDEEIEEIDDLDDADLETEEA